MAGTTFGFWLIWRLVIRYVEDAKNMSEELDDLALGVAGILGATTLLIAGSECVAEEHLLGTLDGQLILPVRVRRQWFWKVAATPFRGLPKTQVFKNVYIDFVGVFIRRFSKTWVFGSPLLCETSGLPSTYY